MTCVLVSMDFTPTLTQACVTSSMPAWTELLRSTLAHPASGSTSTAESATGPRLQIGRSARLILMVCTLIELIGIKHNNNRSFRNLKRVPVPRGLTH